MVTKIFGDKKLTITPLSAKDLKCAKEYADFINSLIKEDAKILMNELQTVKQEKNWTIAAVKDVKNRKKVYLIARDGNKIVGNTSVELGRCKQNHIGKFGIAIRKEYRGIGLGKFLMAEVLNLAKKKMPGIRLFRLEVFKNNKSGMALYKKMGFKTIARVPKHIQYKGRLIAEYIMIKDAK